MRAALRANRAAALPLRRRFFPQARRFLSVNASSGLQQFRLADIGEGIAEVELMKWFVKEGDSIKSFDRICEVQSDKATVEITSRYDGRVESILHAEGSIVKVGSVLVNIRTSSNVQGKLATVDSQAELQGTPTEKPLVAASAPTAFSRDASLLHFLPHGHRAQATPAVRKLAKENCLDLDRISGTGPRGRILKDDVLKLVSGGGGGGGSGAPISSQVAARPLAVDGPAVLPPPTSTTSVQQHYHQQNAADQRIPIRGMQRIMVKSMTAALEVQHLTYCEEIVFDKLVQLRKDLKGVGAARELKISYMPLMIKAASIALSQFPMLNATVSQDCSETIHHAHHNIGIAMDTSRGLVVPVLKHVQSKTILDIAAELAALQEMARSGTLTESHMQGGTFTLSNIGSVGGTYAVPVLFVPQVAIGAFGRLQILPRYVGKDGKVPSMDEIVEGGLTPRPSTVMNVSWSADHRVVDGATVARFSNLWKDLLESPSRMLAELR